jgi:hypothetical protein
MDPNKNGFVLCSKQVIIEIGISSFIGNKHSAIASDKTW